ncbi:MAG: caspase family protein [Crocinitomicaceae bacterium]
MYNYLKFPILLLLLLFSFSLRADRAVEIAIQQGHTDAIHLICTSPDNRFFASYGADHKLILWDNRTGNQMAFVYAHQAVEDIAFHPGSSTVFLTANKEQWKVDAVTMQLTKVRAEDQLSFPARNLTYFSNRQVSIQAAKVVLSEQGGRKLKSRTADYFDQYFTAVIHSKIHQKIFVGNADGLVYVFDEELKLIEQLKGHNADVNDLALSADETYLFSASSDRSIIKWDIKKSKIERRYSGKNYPTFGVSISHDGKQLLFGDEIGYLRSIDLSHPRLEMSVSKKFIYPITHTVQLKDNRILYATDDNRLKIVQPEKKSTTFKNSSWAPHKSLIHYLTVKSLDLYQEPYAHYRSIDISPSENLLLTVNDPDTYEPSYFRIIDLRNPANLKQSKRLYKKEVTSAPLAFFLNDSLIVTSYEEKSIDLWKIKGQDVSKLLYSEIPAPYPLKGLCRLNDTTVFGYTETGIFTYSVFTKHQQDIALENIESVHHLADNLVAVVLYSNEFITVKFEDDSLIFSEPYFGHQDHINTLVYHSSTEFIYSSSMDGSIRIWDTQENRLAVSIIPIGVERAIFVTPDNYYMVTGGNLEYFGFKVDENYFYPEQFDPIYNRPDIIMKRLRYPNENLIHSYERAHEKRIRKLGFTPDMLKADFHLPTLTLQNVEEVTTINEKGTLTVELELKDSRYKLDRINVWVNDVAIYGQNGISIKEQDTQEYTTTVQVSLARGMNKVQLSVLNQAGAESYKSSFEVECTSGKKSPDLYLLTIGVSKYKDSRYNLTYAAKDAVDLAETFKSGKHYEQVHTKTLTDQQVTLKNLASLKDFFSTADINDQVILFVAGHGVLDADFDYYFASHDMDFSNPSTLGIPYEALEGLLDGIKPLKKLLFMDTCHSGEVDKDEIQWSADDGGEKEEDTEIVFRNVGVGVEKKQGQFGLTNTSELVSSLFTDLRKGTGATVIASAGGAEFAMESDRWHNGLFTYCLINGLSNRAADMDGDKEIWLSELKRYVSEQVTSLSQGKQQPTSRIENQTIDFRLW